MDFRTNLWRFLLWKERTQKQRKEEIGEGTIYWSEALNCYVAQYVEPSGKRKTLKQKKNEKSSDFKKRFNDTMANIRNGSYTEKSKDSIVSLAKQDIERRHRNGTTTDRSYKRDLETLEQIKKTCTNFCNIPIQKVTLQNIEEAKTNISQYANSTIDKIWRMLGKSFKMACSPSRKILRYNLMQDEELTKPFSVKSNRKIRALTLAEYQKLISVLDNEEINHPYRNIAKMQIISGMRIGEVLARSFDDFNEKELSFNVHNTLTQDAKYNVILGKYTKTYDKKNQIDRGQRFLPLNNPLFTPLLNIINEEKKKRISNIHSLIFWDYEKSSFISPSEFNSWLGRINKKYSICDEGLSSHMLRHYAITYWGVSGLPMPIIQYLAGHVEGSTLTQNTYINVSFDFANTELKRIFG